MIRRATKKDLKAINHMGEKLHSNFTTIFHMETEISNPLAIVLVSENKNSINGYLYAINLGENIDILSIFVDNMYRLRHIGTNLIKKLKSMNDGTITLEVATTNVGALKLYNKEGFKVVGIRKNYYPGIDAYVMKWGVK